MEITAKVSELYRLKEQFDSILKEVIEQQKVELNETKRKIEKMEVVISVAREIMKIKLNDLNDEEFIFCGLADLATAVQELDKYNEETWKVGDDCWVYSGKVGDCSKVHAVVTIIFDNEIEVQFDTGSLLRVDFSRIEFYE